MQLCNQPITWKRWNSCVKSRRDGSGALDDVHVIRQNGENMWPLSSCVSINMLWNCKLKKKKVWETREFEKKEAKNVNIAKKVFTVTWGSPPPINLLKLKWKNFWHLSHTTWPEEEIKTLRFWKKRSKPSFDNLMETQNIHNRVLAILFNFYTELQQKPG